MNDVRNFPYRGAFRQLLMPATHSRSSARSKRSEQFFQAIEAHAEADFHAGLENKVAGCARFVAESLRKHRLAIRFAQGDGDHRFARIPSFVETFGDHQSFGRNDLANVPSGRHFSAFGTVPYVAVVIPRILTVLA